MFELLELFEFFDILGLEGFEDELTVSFFDPDWVDWGLESTHLLVVRYKKLSTPKRFY